MSERYCAHVDDLLVYTFQCGGLYQYVYRVVSAQYGGENQEGAIQLTPLGHERSDVSGLGQIDAYIPPLLLEKMVKVGILECVWRKPESD